MIIFYNTITGFLFTVVPVVIRMRVLALNEQEKKPNVVEIQSIKAYIEYDTLSNALRVVARETLKKESKKT